MVRKPTLHVVPSNLLRDIPALNVILAGWRRPVAGADSGGGG